MDIYDTAAVHNDIEQQFYKAKINKIMRLAKSGQYTDAFRVIMKIIIVLRITYGPVLHV